MWESRAAFCATFPSGGGNPRFLRISTDAAFPSGQTLLVIPTDSTEDPNVGDSCSSELRGRIVGFQSMDLTDFHAKYYAHEL